MTTTTQKSEAVTTQYDFCSVNRNGDCLFTVRAGVPLSDAFNKLSLLVANASSVMDDAVAITDSSDVQPCAMNAAVELLDMAYALIQAMHLGHNGFENADAQREV
jgi:hypothetical protein